MRLPNRLAGLFAGLMLISSAPAAGAQTQPLPPEHYTLDARGVDLVSGTFNYGTTEVVIGPPGADGLAYGRVWVNGGWRDTLIGGISFASGEMIVSLGPVSEVFVPDGGSGLTWVSKYDNGSTVVMAVGSTTVTDRYGNVTVFETSLGLSPDDNPYGATGGLPSSVTTPDGSVTTYTYNEAQKCFRYIGSQCVDWRSIARVSAIAKNRGYMIKYSYASDDPQDAAYWRVANVRGINLAVDWCDPAADSCSSFTQTWPSVTYDNAEPPLTATDQSGRVTSYSYSNGNTELATIRYPDATADDVAVTYNGSPDLRVSAVADASGSWTYAWSDGGSTQTTTVAGPLGQSLTAVVNMTTGRLVSAKDALNRTWAYQYDSDLRVTRATQPEGDYASYAYDARSNLIATTWVSKGNTLTPITVSSTFPTDCADPAVTPATCNRPLTSTDALGAVTDYEWAETTGLLLSITGPAPAGGADRPQARFAYDAFQARYRSSATTFVNGSPIFLPVEVSACAVGASCAGTANEVLTTVAYPTTASPNNLQPLSASEGSGTTPAMATTAMTWTADGDVATVDGPLIGTADTVTYLYDDARQLVGVIGPDPDGGGVLVNRAQRLIYNSRGQITLIETGTASAGAWANFSAILKSETIYDAGQFFRPVMARQLSAANAVSGLQQVSYDAAGRPSCVAVRMNPETWSSPPSSACNPAATGGYGPDRIVQTTYDAVGRILTSTSAYGTAEALTEGVSYTTNGLIASLTDGRGNVSRLVYDAFDRLERLRYPNPNCCGTSTTDYEAWTYDAAGRLLTERNRAGQTTSYTWDLLGRLIGVDAPPGTMDEAIVYDNLGRVLTSTGNGQTLSNAWDALSRPISETGPLGTMGYQFDPAGRMTRITWPDGFYVKYGHDLYGAVTSAAENGATSGPAVLAQYSYDNLGLLTGIARAGGVGVSTTYGYDAFARLSSLAHDASGTGEDVTFGFSYNPEGQIVGRTVSNDAYIWAPATGTTASAVNGRNEVTSVGGVAVAYDSNRNATVVTGNAYGYDAANRLISATRSGGTAATFDFDPADRLYQSGAAGVPTRFQYAGEQLVAEYDGGGNIVARHIPGVGLDDIAASWDLSSTSPVRLWPLTDERGSVIARSNASASAPHINRYDEYGVPAPGNSGRFQYTGQTWLAGAGAYHYRARTYVPQIGRFLQTDPIGYAAGANLYAYVGADPVNLVDPMGLQSRLPNTRRCTRREEEEAARTSSGSHGSGDVCVALRNEFARSRMPAGGGSTPGYFGWEPSYNPVQNRADYRRYHREYRRVSAENAWMAEPIVALTPGGSVGRLGRAGRAISRVCNCFVAGTDVLTADGMRDIETIEVGDLLLSRDEITGETAFKPVVALIAGAERQIWEVTVETVDAEGAARRETIGTTDEHPWRLVGGDWAETAELYPGAELVTASGARAVVISAVPTDRVERTYNFEVEGFHSYFVGETGLWVHNACRPLYGAIPKFRRQLAASGRAPRWMNQWLRQGRTPPGHSADHLLPRSVGGSDAPSNLRLRTNADHDNRHVFYHPWRP